MDPRTEIIVNKMNESLVEAGNWVKATKEFAVEQAPIVIQEILKWGLVIELFQFIISLMLLIAGIIMLKKSFKDDWYKKADVNYSVGHFFAIMGAWIIFTIGVLTSVIEILDPIKVIVAPRLYLIEYFAHLVR